MGVRESRNPRASPSGHLEAGEPVVAALIREAKEEAGAIVEEHEVEFTRVMHNSSSNGGVAFFFTVHRWVGVPENIEPDKCAGLRWFPLGDLPDHPIPYCRSACRRSGVSIPLAPQFFIYLFDEGPYYWHRIIS